jgi:hypothetical protein
VRVRSSRNKGNTNNKGNTTMAVRNDQRNTGRQWADRRQTMIPQINRRMK